MDQLKQIVNYLDEGRTALLRDIGLLFLRISIGLMMAFAHGFGKIAKLFGPDPIRFADPIGIGVGPSLFLAGSAEFFGSLLIAIGLGTRLSAIPLAITMFVAAFIVHADDPWGKKEFALLYLIPYLTLICTGPGKFSVDHIIRKKLTSSADDLSR